MAVYRDESDRRDDGDNSIGEDVELISGSRQSPRQRQSLLGRVADESLSWGNIGRREGICRRLANAIKKARSAKTGICIIVGCLPLVIGRQLRIVKNEYVRPSDDRLPPSYTPPANVTNEFLARFERLVSAPLPRPLYAPLILEGGTVLCRRSHRDYLLGLRSVPGSYPPGWTLRVGRFVEMLAAGLESETYRGASTDDAHSSLPLLLYDGDDNQCDHAARTDALAFPRLTWSTPAPKFGGGWCRAVGMVCYALWDEFRDQHSYSWDGVFRSLERNFPWRTKIDRAVWRGSTTGVGAAAFDDLPRARLVRKGMERPDAIDAGFTALVQGWERRENETRVAPFLTTSEQMRYKAIIDIDGNDWSSRFGKLLCTNSIIIKIEPDFVEYFYSDLAPMVHYVPASLDNLTAAVAYVMDRTNGGEMRSIVAAANSWCKRTNTREQLPREAVSRARAFGTALRDAYGDGWVREWDRVRERIHDRVGGDLVRCASDEGRDDDAFGTRTGDFFCRRFGRCKLNWRRL